MGLASALSTALTGMNAAETTIDVVGNNLANTSTVGFKASEANFATQFLQTRSLGSAPTETSGGTNPRQIGLGVLTAEITPDFTQGTIEVSNSPSDLAIQGDGFFIVEANSGEQLYTRNGIFKTNAENELVTITGNRLLGYGVNEDFELQSGNLVPISIPLGNAAVAEATENVQFAGVLTPTGDVATTAEIIESAVLGDGSATAPVPPGTAAAGVAPSPSGSLTAAPSAPGIAPNIAAGTYHYKMTLVDSNGGESSAVNLTVTVPPGDADTIDFSAFPTGTAPPYVSRNLYRTDTSGDANGPYYLLANFPGVAGGTPYSDNVTTQPPPGAPQTIENLDGSYTYYITFTAPGFPESRPVRFGDPVSVSDGHIQLTDLPVPSGDYTGGMVAIYRNSATNPNEFRRVAEIDTSVNNDYVDGMGDTEQAAQLEIDFDGPKINPSTPLVNVTRWNGNTYINPFVEGDLSFAATKGASTFPAETLQITSSTTVQELADFMTSVFGVHTSADDPAMPSTVDTGGGPAIDPGGYVDGASGTLRFVGNNGVANAISIDNQAFTMTSTTGAVTTPNLSFLSTQEAVGQSATTTFQVYDSLGIPIDLRVTTVLESTSDTATTYRWFAESPGNDTLTGIDVTVGTGLIQFDGNGNLIGGAQPTVLIDRSNIAALQPLEIALDFSNVSGLAADNSSLNAAFRDGFAAGTLSSFIVGEDGLIRGVFTNGATQPLGQIRLARFANPAGLEARGENTFALGINSGLPIEGNPGELGIGEIIAGATELSNTDIGKNLIDLILASTMYRGNTRVITTSQQLFDELLNLRR
jgi:flagellar hook protein FlgE